MTCLSFARLLRSRVYPWKVKKIQVEMPLTPNPNPKLATWDRFWNETVMRILRALSTGPGPSSTSKHY